MNKDNVQKAINIMKRAGKFDMCVWQERNPKAISTEQQLHTCNTAACFAGWIAVSPEFKADGGTVSSYGAPIFDAIFCVFHEDKAIACWLGISSLLAAELCAIERNTITDYSYFYDKHVDDITAEDVVKKLEQLLAGELSDGSITSKINTQNI